MEPILGLLFHAIGGFAAGSFYLPLKKVKVWAWESYWLINGLVSWILMPLLVALITVPDLKILLVENAPKNSLFWSYFFGLLWGVGGLTFGLAMRYLGMSLGMSLALALTAMFGTLIPSIYFGEFFDMLIQKSGLVTLGGILITLIGILFTGWAGFRKDAETSEREKKIGVKEFDLKKGVWIALLAGIMSACMAFAIQAGQPIAELAVRYGAPPLFKNSPVFVVIFAGGFTSNLVWCMYLSIKNKTISDYTDLSSPLVINYLLSFSAGVIWYFQFMFYGMGTTQMGRYDFASWSIHFAFVIFFSNLWGLITKEWGEVSNKTTYLIYGGLLLLIFSAFIIGYGSYMVE